MRCGLAALVVLAAIGSAGAETKSTADASAGRAAIDRAARQRDRMMAPAHFADLAAIRSWAQHESWGGNHVDVLKFGGREVVVVRRSFTSGLMTCGLNVFVPADGGWEPSLALRPVAGFLLKVTQDGDAVRILNSKTGTEVASFSIAGLQANPALKHTGLRPAG